MRYETSLAQHKAVMQSNPQPLKVHVQMTWLVSVCLTDEESTWFVLYVLPRWI